MGYNQIWFSQGNQWKRGVPVLNEVEIKILEIDRGKAENMLIAAGAEKIFDGRIHAVYFDFGDSSIHKSGGTLRLRREGGRTVLTFKKDVRDRSAKIREEEEVEVSDFGTMNFILEAIGLSAWLEMSKHRTTWQLGGTHFEFDKYHNSYEYIPEFLEIESTDVETAYRHAEMLGFSRQDCKPWDALEVAAYYSGRRSGQYQGPGK
jgi:predicted adenylyl cyclase CyaB